MVPGPGILNTTAALATAYGAYSPVLAISGQVTRSPLAMREARATAQCPLFTPFELQAGALVPAITGASDQEISRRLASLGTGYAFDLAELEELETISDPRLRRRIIDEQHAFMYPEDFGDTA